MLSENDLIVKSTEDMRQEIEDLIAESKLLREGHDTALQKEEALRLESVETRRTDPELSEMLWQEAENLHSESKEMLRESLEKKLRAVELQHRIDIRSQIESLNNYEEIWKRAAKTRRS